MRRERDRKALERNVLSVFERSGRAFAPSASAWHRSGDLLSDMARKEGLEIARVSKSFANDVLLALSCREAGCVLVTENGGTSSGSVGTYPSTTSGPGPAESCRERMLIVLSGLPGAGKTTIARELAHSLAAVRLRIDSREQELRHTGLVVEAEG